MKKFLFIIPILLICSVCSADTYVGGKLVLECDSLIVEDDIECFGSLTVLNELTVGGLITDTPVFGFISIYNATKSTTLSTTDTYYEITDLSTTGSSKCTVDGANGDLTINVSGTYYVSYALSFNADKVCVIHTDIWVNGADSETIAFNRKISNANDVGNASASGMINFDPGDVVDLRVKSTVTNTDLEVIYATFQVHRIGRKY